MARFPVSAMPPRATATRVQAVVVQSKGKMPVENPNSNYACPTCAYITDDAVTLSKHCSQHERLMGNGQPKPYTCRLQCTQFYYRRSSFMAMHYEKVHAMGKKDVDKMIAQDEEAMRRPKGKPSVKVLAVKTKNERNFVGRTTDGSAVYKTTQNAPPGTHNGVKKCGMSIASLATALPTVTLSTVTQPRPDTQAAGQLFCLICYKGAFTLSALRAHHDLHISKDKPFKCRAPSCVEMYFTDAARTSAHYREAHSMVGRKFETIIRQLLTLDGWAGEAPTTKPRAPVTVRVASKERATRQQQPQVNQQVQQPQQQQPLARQALKPEKVQARQPTQQPRRQPAPQLTRLLSPQPPPEEPEEEQAPPTVNQSTINQQSIARAETPVQIIDDEPLATITLTDSPRRSKVKADKYDITVAEQQMSNCKLFKMALSEFTQGRYHKAGPLFCSHMHVLCSQMTSNRNSSIPTLRAYIQASQCLLIANDNNTSIEDGFYAHMYAVICLKNGPLHHIYAQAMVNFVKWSLRFDLLKFAQSLCLLALSELSDVDDTQYRNFIVTQQKKLDEAEEMQKLRGDKSAKYRFLQMNIGRELRAKQPMQRFCSRRIRPLLQEDAATARKCEMCHAVFSEVRITEQPDVGGDLCRICNLGELRTVGNTKLKRKAEK